MKKVKVKKAAPKLYPCHCNQCGYDWPSKKKHPKHCARCISDKWDKELIGKRLRKAVPSRLTRGSRKKGASGKTSEKRAAKGLAASEKSIASRSKKTQARKERMVEEPITGNAVKAKAPRAPRVKKEKPTLTPEQFDKKVTEP